MITPLLPAQTVALTVRAMRYQDVDAVLVIEQDQYRYPWTEKLFKDCIATGYHCVVVENKGDTVAYAILMNGYREGHILNICVSRSWQGKGLGRVLLRYLSETAAVLGAEDIFLEVRPSNTAAIRLYESSGFNEVGRRPNYYNSDSGREDAIIMAAALAGFAFNESGAQEVSPDESPGESPDESGDRSPNQHLPAELLLSVSADQDAL